MTDIQHNTDPVAAHAALDAAVERESIRLDAIETGWRHAGNRECAEIERRWCQLYDKRAALDDDVLAVADGGRHLWQKLSIVGRIIELNPERGAALLRRLADQVEEWSRGETTCAG